MQQGGGGGWGGLLLSRSSGSGSGGASGGISLLAAAAALLTDGRGGGGRDLGPAALGVNPVGPLTAPLLTPAEGVWGEDTTQSRIKSGFRVFLHLSVLGL